MRTLIVSLALIVNALVLTACGKDTPQDIINPRQEFKIVKEPAFEPLMQKFERLTGMSAKRVSTRFAQLGDTVAGLCFSAANGLREIEIDTDFWEYATDMEKENLIFHEAGHCILNLGHTEDLIKVGTLMIPKSIMYPSVFGAFPFYEENQDYYHEELKSHVKR